MDELHVSALDFIDAITRLPKMKRAPAGARGNIPKDTQLLPDADGVNVSTPVMSTLVLGDQAWRDSISVDASQLSKLSVTLKKLGASRKTDQVSLSFNDGKLLVRFETTTLSIQAIDVK